MPKHEYSCDCPIIHHEKVESVQKKMLQDPDFAQVTAFFKVLGDNTRLRILWALDQEELCVCDIASVLSMTKSAVSHQLGTLRRANLVRCRREGKTVFYTLADHHVRQILEAGLEHIKEES